METSTQGDGAGPEAPAEDPREAKNSQAPPPYRSVLRLTTWGRWGQGEALIPGTRGLRYHYQSSFECITADMIELNPVRQRITDLTDRVLSLRGYL